MSQILCYPEQMKHPLPQYIPTVDDAPPNHWYWDSLGHEWGPWYRLHRLGDLVTESPRRFIYYKRCNEDVKDKLALINAQAIQDRDDAFDHAKKRHSRGNRKVTAQDRIAELFTDAGKIVEQTKTEIDAIVAEHLATLSKEQQAANEAVFNPRLEHERFGAAHSRFRQGQPRGIPKFLRRAEN